MNERRSTTVSPLSRSVRHAALPLGATLFEWRDGANSLLLRYDGGTTFSTVASGMMLVRGAEAFIHELDRLVQMDFRQMRFFHDWRAMSGYEPATRQMLTAWRRNAPAGTTESIHVLLQSNVVTLGVAASAIVLRAVGIELHIYTKVTSFDAMKRAQK